LKTKNKGEKYELSKALQLYTHTHTHTHTSISLIENNKKVIVKYNLIYDAKNLRKE
jgi:hypothetical protein